MKIEVLANDARDGMAPSFVWASTSMGHLMQYAAQIGASEAKVLISGESGAGKSLIAQFVHRNSPRSHGPFVPISCGTLSDTLLESELFGHVRGAFTGAYRDKAGQLQRAHQGTLFLDEVGEMSPRMQALLLRFLENGEIQPIGAQAACAKVDTRVLAATNRDLDERVKHGLFRGDLLYRLRVIHLVVPPLRERPDDIDVLARHFLSRGSRRVSLSDEAMRLLRAYRWPGNARELRNLVERLLIQVTSDVILPEHLPEQLRARTPGRETGRRERRRQVSDAMYDALVSGKCGFWEDVHRALLARDITRHDVRELVRHGLTTVRGNYHALLTLFGMPQEDYKKFLNFLTTHDCRVDFRPLRSASTTDWRPTRGPNLFPDTSMQDNE